MLHDLSLLDDGALAAGPCTQTTSKGPAGKVLFALLSRYPLYSSEDPDGAMDLTPVEDESCARISIELVRFTRVIVGVKDESAVIELLEEDNAGRWNAFWGGGGKSHGLWLVNVVVDDGVFEPVFELPERVFIDVMRRKLFMGDVLDVRENFDFVLGDGDVHVYIRQLPTCVPSPSCFIPFTTSQPFAGKLQAMSLQNSSALPLLLCPEKC